MSSPNIKAASQRLSQALNESRKLFNQLSTQAKSASATGSSTLFGMLGGFVGTGLAYSLTLYSSASMLVLAPILAGAGVVLGVLTFRGTKTFKLESRLEMHQRAIETVRNEIRLIPKNAPQHLKDEAWNTYAKLLSSTPTYSIVRPLPSLPMQTTVPTLPNAPPLPDCSNRSLQPNSAR